MIEGPNMGFNIKMAKPLVFNRKGKAKRFIIVYRLYLRMKMREASVEEQI